MLQDCVSGYASNFPTIGVMGKTLQGEEEATEFSLISITPQ